jgi:hypothetical protein
MYSYPSFLLDWAKTDPFIGHPVTHQTRRRRCLSQSVAQHIGGAQCAGDNR